MTWLTLPHLTDGQYYWVCFAVVGFMAVTGWLMARSLWRRHQAARSLVRARAAHPANRQQPSHVRRVA